MKTSIEINKDICKQGFTIHEVLKQVGVYKYRDAGYVVVLNGGSSFWVSICSYLIESIDISLWRETDLLYLSDDKLTLTFKN